MMRNHQTLRRKLERVAPAGRLNNSVSPLAVAEKLWSTLDTPLSLGLHLLVKNGQVRDALAVKFQPGRYLEADVGAARDDYQAVAFLQKTPLDLEGVDREKAAWEVFLQAEEQCRLTNARFRSMRRDYGTKVPRGVLAVITAAGHKISHLLGPRPDARSWALRCRFGPGADVLNRGSHAQAYYKLQEMSVTKDFHCGAQALVLSQPGWYKHIPFSVDSNGFVDCGMKVVPGNSVTFVPKTALIDRSIAIEPGMNIYAQLGLGAIIRARLKRAGLDLDNADPNRGLAKLGSIKGTVATIDLSSASDTLAREVVRELLPDGWYAALDWVRSKSGTYVPKGSDPVNIRYEKFSSMGNGYTFELESMIFYALAFECTRLCHADTSLVRSFGDDITVPTEVVPLLEEVLSFCGFTVNLAKSYTQGSFRESCGMDFFSGVNIRPFYLKEGSLDSVSSLYRLANGLRRVAFRRNLGFGCDRKLRPVWTYVVERIPSAFRDFVIPPQPVVYRDFRLATEVEVAEGDGGLMSNWHEASVSPHVSFNRDLQRGWLYSTYKGGARHVRAACENRLLCYALYSSRDGNNDVETVTMDRLPIRGVASPRLNQGLFTPDWPDLGLWC